MQNSFDGEILKRASSWIEQKNAVIIATVIQTWGSSPSPVGSKMIINNNGEFLGSVSGGCVESAVIKESKELFKKKESYKKIKFNVADKNAWNIGLTCGGEISIFLEKIK